MTKIDFDKSALPAWATLNKVTPKGQPEVTVDYGKMFPAYLEELGVTNITQYWMEVCRYFMKCDLKMALKTDNIFIRLKSDTASKIQWRQAEYPKGDCVLPENKGLDPVEAATRGKEAKHHFKRLRGFVPA